MCTLGMSNLVWKKSKGSENLPSKMKLSAFVKIVEIPESLIKNRPTIVERQCNCSG